MNGRSGQSQNGVDIFGQRDNMNWVGIQCKKKYEEKVTDSELRSEIEKSKNFKPTITEFFMVTTAPRDQSIQESARLITEELTNTDYPIKVFVWGWDDIEENASKYEKAWKAFDRTWTPFVEEGFKRSSNEHKLLDNKLDHLISMVSSLNPTENIKTDANNEGTHLHGQITILQNLIDEGNVMLALDQLIKLKNEKWENASASERYRILVSTASAKHKLNSHEEAGQLLIKAYEEYPEYKYANQNLATGYLLINDYKKAVSFAKETLEKDKMNSQLASILIQARIKNASCENPLDDISAELHETDDVLIALIQFYRTRDNQIWVDIAKRAIEKYPKNDLIKILYAEGILDMTIRMEHDAMAGGVLKKISSKDFNDAVEILYFEACRAINEYSEFLKSTVHNAALALRIKNDYIRAKEILDKAIDKYPYDENLCLQRGIIAHLEKDPKSVLKFLPKDSENPEVISLRIGALIETNNDDAIALLESADGSNYPDRVKFTMLFDRLSLYVKKGNEQTAIDTITEKIKLEPDNLYYRILEIKIYRMIGNKQKAEASFNKAIALVSTLTELYFRIELSFEAQRLNREDEIVDLLRGRVSTIHDNEGLQMLIMALLNSCCWFTCREILDSISPEIKNIRWIQRAEVVLALNTGDVYISQKIDKYLENYPYDLDILLARISIYQREGTNEDVKRFLKDIDFDKLEGVSEQRVRLATIVCYYDDAYKGLNFAYSTLMNNWTNPRVHLAYQSLMLLNDKIESILPNCDVVQENTVVGIKSENKEKRYRLENKRYSFFEEDRVDTNNKLYLLLINKKVGEEITLQNYIGAKLEKISWIKSIFIDALHRSFDYFEERFPNTEGMMRFDINSNLDDPLKDIREFMKARSENGLYLLDMYRSKGIPLSFVAILSGNDLIDTWRALKGLNYQFLVCNGSSNERDEVQEKIKNYNKHGCILDAITLSLIRSLEVENAVTSVCGQMYIPQSVMDYLTSRHMIKTQNIGKEMGSMVWQKDRLVFENYSQDYLKGFAEECEKELHWAKRNILIASSIPKFDLSKEDRLMREKLGNVICDIAFAANGNNLIILSEDMGYRKWVSERFNIPAIWLQPVLMIARSEGYITNEKYFEAINQLVYMGHTYVSLDSDCLMYQAQKDNFSVTKNLSQLLEMVGGENADFITNTGVLSDFINKLCGKCYDEFKLGRILGEIFSTFSKGRKEDLRTIVLYITQNVTLKGNFVRKYSLDWLVGHSFGMPYLNDLLNQKELRDIIN
jgi:tetratricopeptide (TPR) repeat protein